MKSHQQRKAFHKGCQEIADLLVEHGVSLNTVIQNIEVRPTMHSVKDILRSVARSKYGVDSTEQLDTHQMNQVWEEVTKTISEVTGVFVPFPCMENTPEFLASLDQYAK